MPKFEVIVFNEMIHLRIVVKTFHLQTILIFDVFPSMENFIKKIFSMYYPKYI
jgi:hypothetical protein